MSDKSIGPLVDVADADVALLRVVMSEPSDTEEAWAAWTALADLDHLSDHAYALLSRANAVTERAGIEHPWVPRLRGYHKRQWTERQLRVAAYNDVAEALDSAGIAHLSPAAVLIASELPDQPPHVSGRPRISVRWTETPDALDALAHAGWAPAPSHGARRPSLRSRLTATTQTLEHPTLGRVDLVNFFNPVLVDGDRDAPVWERADPPGVSSSDLLLAALTDQHGLPGAIEWAGTSHDLLARIGDDVDLVGILSRPGGKTAVELIDARLDFLADAQFETGLFELRSQTAVARPHTERSPLQRRTATIKRLPTAAREITARSGGVVGLLREARHSS